MKAPFKRSFVGNINSDVSFELISRFLLLRVCRCFASVS